MSERDTRRQGFRKKSSSESPTRVRQGADARADAATYCFAPDPKWQIASNDKRRVAQDCAPGHGADKIDVEKRRGDSDKLETRRSSSSAAEKTPVPEIPASNKRDRPHSPFKPSPRHVPHKTDADTPRQGISTARRSSSPLGLQRGQRHDRRSSSPTVISRSVTHQPRKHEATQSAEPSRQHFLRILFDKCVVTYPVSLGRGGHLVTDC